MYPDSLYVLSITEEYSQRERETERRGGGHVYRYLHSKSNVYIENETQVVCCSVTGTGTKTLITEMSMKLIILRHGAHGSEKATLASR